MQIFCKNGVKSIDGKTLLVKMKSFVVVTGTGNMFARFRQFAAAIQLFALLLGGGLGEALHALPGLAHVGHGCGHSCCGHDHAGHRHVHRHGEAPLGRSKARPAIEPQPADTQLDAKHDCVICQQLRLWRQAVVAPVRQFAIAVAAQPHVAAADPPAIVSGKLVPNSRGPPAVL
ncbi:hypothetical protein [Blastopirellula marina]|uniref:Uncharacterized protein n=1 Tax=Blastopirellula marina TaxID=124 RepID=A0A2S8GQJ7_9BACT|nr:hypothetical protein [Blastopirellula marina]PQO46708.1 hypothetical protein C5Y93_07695 [Blastopirellula marina]